MKKLETTIALVSILTVCAYIGVCRAQDPNDDMEINKNEMTEEPQKQTEKPKKDFWLTEEYDEEEPNMSDDERIWKDVEKSGEKEASQWLRTDAGNIAVLAKDVNEQCLEELNLLLKFAQEEKAEKTIQAIEKLMEIKADRYDKIIEKAKDERRQRLLQQREERRNRGSERMSREDRMRMREERMQNRSSRRGTEEEGMFDQ